MDGHRQFFLKILMIILFKNYFFIECETPLCGDDPSYCTDPSLCSIPAITSNCPKLCGICGPTTTTTTTTTTTCPPLECENGFYKSDICECECNCYCFLF